MHRLLLLILVVLALPARAGTATALVIEIQKFAFSQPEITVQPGTTVTWINRDEVPHNVIGKDHAFASKALDTGDRFDYDFTQEGDYVYACSLHPFMTGIVHVHP